MPRTYEPPSLNRRIFVRDPALEPEWERDRRGRITDFAEWGVGAWAHRRDQSPYTEIAEGVRVRAGRSVFTMRSRRIPANAIIVDRGGVVYESIGPGVVRGGPAAGLRAEYVEVTAERRAAA